MWIFALHEPTTLGIAAAVSTLIGTVLSVAGYIANRRTTAEKAEAEAHKEVMEARAEAERLSAELHKLRMKHGETAE